MILENRIFANSDGRIDSGLSGAGMFLSFASFRRVSLQVCSCSQFWQSPSCLYQTWMPVLAEKVTMALVLKCVLYPVSTPVAGFTVSILILLILAISSRESWTFAFAMPSALWTVCRVTFSFLATLASASPVFLRFQMVF